MRRSFALTGPRRPLDTETQAVRRDLADIRLAEYVFAPHYAAPLAMSVATPAPFRSGPMEDAPLIAMLAVGDLFEALDFERGQVWGVVPRLGRVGYVAQGALVSLGEID
ncbi:MAG: hypothetical protein C0500_01015 [Sphingobium sp.]|nr:hypothetical protein [Sphingobium sp.]